MQRFPFFFASSLAAASLALASLGEREAAACGGCFHPPTQVASDITDERMLFAVSTKQTSLYDQIRYAGSPSSFAWVLPIKGTVEVGLSADVLFDSMDVLTATQIQAPPQNCPPPPAECRGKGAFGGVDGGLALPPEAPGGGVTVTKRENVGPYATVQLHSTTPGALSQWLTDNGFQIPDDVKPTIEQYVGEGFDFLAMKLLPNQGVQAMRPVRVTSGGASFSLPLRMAAVGTGVSVGITIWIVADGRYQPQNFPFYRIEDKDLVWDWSTSASNYTTLRAQNEGNLGGKGWEIESSLTLNQQLIADVITSGGVYYRGGGGGFSGAADANASDDYLPVAANGSTPAQTAAEVRAADIAALFAGMTAPNVRVTRMRSDIVHAAMTTDLVIQAAPDQSELSNVRNVTQSVNLQCPVYDANCNVIGTAPVGSPALQASGSSSSGGCAATARETRLSDLVLAGAGCLGLGVLVRAQRRRARKRKG